MTKKLYVEIDEEIIKELKKLAKDEGKFLSRFTQYIIQKGLKEYKENKLEVDYE